MPSTNLRHILVVEDNESDVFLILRAIRLTKLPVSLHLAKDGDQAVQFFEDVERDPMKPSPDLVLIDINLPRRRGGEVVKYIRSTSRCAKAHIIAVSTSDSPRDREEMKELGADGYFRKPTDFGEFMKLGDLIKAVFISNPR